MLGIAVLGAIVTMCGIIATMCAAALRLGMFLIGDQKFSVTDDNSKLCGAIAGILFGFILVLWIKVPHHEQS